MSLIRRRDRHHRAFSLFGIGNSFVSYGKSRRPLAWRRAGLNVDETDMVAHIRTLCAADDPGLYSRLFLNERELFDFETVAEIGRSAVLTSILQESHFTLTSSTDGKVKLFDEGGRCLRTNRPRMFFSNTASATANQFSSV